MAEKRAVVAAWTVQSAGTWRLTVTLLIVVLPVLVMLAVVVVGVPEVSVGWLCVPCTVLAVCTATAGLPDWPSVTRMRGRAS